MDGWNTTFLLGRPIFRGYVSFREGTSNLRFCYALILASRQDNDSADGLGAPSDTSRPVGDVPQHEVTVVVGRVVVGIHA